MLNNKKWENISKLTLTWKKVLIDGKKERKRERLKTHYYESSTITCEKEQHSYIGYITTVTNISLDILYYMKRSAIDWKREDREKKHPQNVYV